MSHIIWGYFKPVLATHVVSGHVHSAADQLAKRARQNLPQRAVRRWHALVGRQFGHRQDGERYGEHSVQVHSTEMKQKPTQNDRGVSVRYHVQSS